MGGDQAKDLPRSCSASVKEACRAPEKPAVQVEKPKEALELEPCGGVWKPDDGLHVARERPDARGQNLMAQKFDLLLAKNGLEHVDGQAILMKTAKHLRKMLSVRGVVRACNQNVIEVDKNKRQSSNINSEVYKSPVAGNRAMRSSAIWKLLRSYISINFSLRTWYGSSADGVRRSGMRWMHLLFRTWTM